MFLESLYSKNFRNFESLKLDLSPGRTIIVGNNGVGKTNLLEMIYFLSTFGSFRTSNDHDLLRFGESFFVVSGLYGDKEVKVHYSDRKEVFISGIKQKSLRESFGTIPVVALTSHDLEIINGLPSRRRRFMNIGISLYKRTYINYLSEYNRAKKQRNRLLQGAKKGKSINGIEVWEKQLSTATFPIISARNEFVNRLVQYAVPIFHQLTGRTLEIGYKKGGDYNNLELQLKRMRDTEIERGYTLFGPHRDDIILKVDSHPAQVSASFGIKRILAISLRMALSRILTEARGEEPIIIIDEVLGELDRRNLGALSEFIQKSEKVLIATTRNDLMKNEDFNIYRIEEKNGAPLIRKGA